MRKHWVGVVGAAQDFVADSTILMQQVGGTGGLADAFTVLRMLGEYIIFPTNAPVAGDEAELCVGICVVSSDAATVGSASMPDPCDDHGYPWLYWASHPIGFNGTSVVAALASASVRHSFDVKSMRKIKPSESLVTIAQFSNVSGGGDPPTTIVIGGLRVLLAH